MISFLLKEWISDTLDVELDIIFVGLYNNIVLPRTGPFIVLQEQRSKKLETPYYSTNKDVIQELVSTRYQIDFYRTTDLANQFYLNISSYNVPDFCNFIDYDVPKNLTGVDSEQKYLLRYSMKLTASHYITTNKQQARFNTADIQLKTIK